MTGSPPKAAVAPPANTRHRHTVVLMLRQRLRRWPNIRPAIGQCLVFTGAVSMTLHDYINIDLILASPSGLSAVIHGDAGQKIFALFFRPLVNYP